MSTIPRELLFPPDLFLYQVTIHQFFRQLRRNAFVPGITRSGKYHRPMGALARAFGTDRADVVVQLLSGNRLADLRSSIIGTLTQAGVTVADKKNVFDFSQVFDGHMLFFKLLSRKRIPY